MQDHIPDALITAFERQYDSSWNDPQLRNERLAMRYGWAAAIEQKQCLLQIQEPASNHSEIPSSSVMPNNCAAAVAVPDEREAFEAWAREYGTWDVERDDVQSIGIASYTDVAVVVAWHAWQARAALAATPAADAQVPKGTYVSISGELKPDVSVYSTPVAAPVVLPEPDAAVMEVMRLVDELRILSIGHGQRFSGISTASDQAFDESANMLTHQSSAIESKLRALLAGVSAPAAQPERKYICPVRTIADLVNNLMLMDQAMPIYGAQYIERPAGQRRAIAVPPTVSIERVKDSRWIGEGETLNTAIIWTRAEQPAAPQAQADARDALTLAELMEVRHALHEIAACGEAKAAYSLLLRAANLNYLDCAQFVGFEAGTFALDAAIAAAKGE